MDFQTSCKDSITKSDISPRKLNYNTTKSTVENLKKKKNCIIKLEVAISFIKQFCMIYCDRHSLRFLVYFLCIALFSCSFHKNLSGYV